MYSYNYFSYFSDIFVRKIRENVLLMSANATFWQNSGISWSCNIEERIYQHDIPTKYICRLDSGLRGKDKGGAPPIKSLLHGSGPSPNVNSPFSTPTQVTFS